MVIRVSSRTATSLIPDRGGRDIVAFTGIIVVPSIYCILSTMRRSIHILVVVIVVVISTVRLALVLVILILVLLLLRRVDVSSEELFRQIIKLATIDVAAEK